MSFVASVSEPVRSVVCLFRLLCETVRFAVNLFASSYIRESLSLSHSLPSLLYLFLSLTLCLSSLLSLSFSLFFLSLCVCVCVSVCVSLSLCLSLCVCVSLSLCARHVFRMDSDPSPDDDGWATEARGCAALCAVRQQNATYACAAQTTVGCGLMSRVCHLVCHVFVTCLPPCLSRVRHVFVTVFVTCLSPCLSRVCRLVCHVFVTCLSRVYHVFVTVFVTCLPRVCHMFSTFVEQRYPH